MQVWCYNLHLSDIYIRSNYVIVLSLHSLSLVTTFQMKTHTRGFFFTRVNGVPGLSHSSVDRTHSLKFVPCNFNRLLFCFTPKNSYLWCIYFFFRKRIISNNKFCEAVQCTTSKIPILYVVAKSFMLFLNDYTSLW